MSEERMQILKMLESGQITAQEAAELLSALKPEEEASAGAPRGWLRIRVTDLATGSAKVHVNVPLSLVNAALRLGARFAPKTASFDPQEVLSAIRSGNRGKILDVEDLEGGERVEIYIE